MGFYKPTSNSGIEKEAKKDAAKHGYSPMVGRQNRVYLILWCPRVDSSKNKK